MIHIIFMMMLIYGIVNDNRLEAGATNDETKDLMTKEDGIIVVLSSLFEKFAKGIKNKHYLRVVVYYHICVTAIHVIIN